MSNRSLIYLIGPDTTRVVGIASRFIKKPKNPHLEIVRRILMLVKEHLNIYSFTRKIKIARSLVIVMHNMLNVDIHEDQQ